MPKRHAHVHEVRAEQDIPLGKVVVEECATRLQDSDALPHPSVAPRYVGSVIQVVLAVRAVLLPKIERWISEHGVNAFVADRWKQLEAIGMEQCAQIGSVEWLGGNGWNVHERAHIEAGPVKGKAGLGVGVLRQRERPRRRGVF